MSADPTVFTDEVLRTQEAAQDFAERATEAIVEDRAAVTLRGDIDERGRLYGAVAGEMRPLVFQVAEMAQSEPHGLLAAAEYLHGRLEREPLRSSPAWEAQRVVVGLFQMALVNVVARVEVVTAEERAALRPGYMRDAVAAVTAAFDSTYIPPADDPAEAEPEEDLVSVTPPAPESIDADLLALL